MKLKSIKIPKHISIIPDGNRRWASSKGLAVFAGHEKSAGFDNIIPLLEKAKELGIEYVSFWAFSTDNWNRPQREIDFLFRLIPKFLAQFKDYALKNGIRFRHLGRKDRIPENVRNILEEVEKVTSDFTAGMSVQVCLDYGGRDEIVRAVKKILKNHDGENLTEEKFSDYLDTKDIPDLDLLIRTSGENRTSGLMPFQAAYAELYFEDKCFPDFSAEDLEKAVKEFSERKRNFGR